MIYYAVVCDILHILLDEDDTQFLLLQEISSILNSSVVKYWFPKPRVCGSIPSLSMYFFQLSFFHVIFPLFFVAFFFVLKRAKRAFWAKVIRMQKWNANEKKNWQKNWKRITWSNQGLNPQNFCILIVSPVLYHWATEDCWKWWQSHQALFS